MLISEIEKIQITGELDSDMKTIKRIFEKDFTLNIRFFECTAKKKRFCLAFFDGMVSNELIDQHIIMPVTKYQGSEDILDLNFVAQFILSTDQANITKKLHDAINMMLYGDTLIFAQGYTDIIVASTKGFKTRGIDEPNGEKLIRGPREGFTESIMTNTSLLRRKLLTPDLKLDTKVVTKRTSMRICVCYLDSLVNKNVLRRLYDRLNKISIDTLLDSNYVDELVRDDKLSPFKTVGTTEKPDIAAAKLLEGKVVILVDGSPVALTVPFLFLEYFQKGDDYYINFYYGSFSRLLRIFGFLLTISVPAVYIALVTYHYEIIPTKLLMSISAAREGVPFPTFIEMLILLAAFDLLREAGAMMPASVGQALSTVGAIVVGQAAVDARIVSAPMVIVLALTGLTGMMSPKIQSAAMVIRLFFLILAAIMGLYGYAVGICMLILYLMDEESFGIPYMSYLTMTKPADFRDTFLRLPIWMLSFRPKKGMDRDYIRTDDKS